MKLSLLLLPLFIHFALSAPNYSDLNTGDFSTTQCRTSTSAFVQSPITITTPTCTAYTSFDLTMNDNTVTTKPATDNNSGALQLNYDGTTLTYNGVTYTSSVLSFRTTSEHILPQNTAVSGAELQIEMSSGSKKAVLSFLIKDLGADSATDSNKLYQYFASPYYYVLQDFAPTAASGWQFHFQTLSDLIKDRVANDGFLNFYTYEGSLTYGTCDEATWFIYGTELYATSTVIAAIQTANGQANARPQSVTGGGYGEHAATRLCFTGYFDLYMNYNYGLWFGVVIILLYFIITLIMGDSPIKDSDYHEDVWTHQPLASIWKYGNEIHTRKSRVSLILVMVTIHALFSSAFYRDASDPTKSSNTIVFAVYSMLINLVITFFVGNILRKYYLAKHQYYKTKEEAWEQKAQNRLFGYYIVVFAIIAVGWSFTVWNMGELHAETDHKSSDLWVASLFIGLGLEMLVVYPLACVLAKRSNFIRRLIKSVGFMYDGLCHDTYMDSIKQD